MPSVYGISTSALRAFQQALSTTSHNIANVNTPGYSRQRVELENRTPEYAGVGYLGSGVQAASVERVFDGFVVEEVRNSQSSFHQQQTFFDLSRQVDNLLGDAATGLSPGLQGFFDAVQEVANDPTSTSARQVMLTEGETLISRFQQIDQRFEDSRQRVNGELRTVVAEINSLAQNIARLNEDIVNASARGAGQPPNDLLDQRDATIEQLAERVAVTAVAQDDGAVNVFIGTGQNLVLGSDVATLTAESLGQDRDHLEIGLVSPGGTIPITNLITGGRLSGILEFRDRVLDPAQNALGRIAVGVVDQFNRQHRLGMDLNGNVGGDFFVPLQPELTADPNNSGSGAVQVGFADVNQLTLDDYRLSYDGAAWGLTRVGDGQSVPFASGSGTAADPYLVDGLSIVVDPAPAAGDNYLLRPTHGAVAQLGLAISDNRQIAAAGPLVSAPANGNAGDGQVSPVQVLDASDPNFLYPVNIVFDDPSTSYRINGGPSVAYTSGADIDVNGWRVQIDGNPQAGDTFTIQNNAGGVGDNSNALRLAGLQQALTLANGTASFDGAYTTLVADVGTLTRQAEINTAAQERLLEQAQAERDSISGVNLDEEAANLLKFQQAYQAAAQVIATADLMFETLLGAVRR